MFSLEPTHDASWVLHAPFPLLLPPSLLEPSVRKCLYPFFVLNCVEKLSFPPSVPSESQGLNIRREIGRSVSCLFLTIIPLFFPLFSSFSTSKAIDRKFRRPFPCDRFLSVDSLLSSGTARTPLPSLHAAIERLFFLSRLMREDRDECSLSFGRV